MERILKANKSDRYALIPVYKNNEKFELECHYNGQMIWCVRVPKPVAGEEPLFMGAMPLGEFKGDDCSFTFRCDMVDEENGDIQDSRANSTGENNVYHRFLEQISSGTKEQALVNTHPAIHFTANNGWINDPNGLLYKDGLFHMYFQYNPVDVQWENMCWGHAVSKDLLHWQQLEPVLYPDETGTMFSGSGILNKEGRLDLGLGDRNKDAMVFYYTAAGSFSRMSKGVKFTQRIAYSIDGGQTLIKTGKVAVPFIVNENRDPKVYYYAPKDSYYMVLYLDGDEFAILTSKDMEHFTVSQRVYMPGSGECPDLREITDEDGNRHWMFSQADGCYFIGDFDGGIITRTSDFKQGYGNQTPYAAQTFSNVDGRVIHVAFLRAECKTSTYTNVMSLPRELSFVKVNGELELSMKPVREYLQARKESKAYRFLVGEGLAKELVVDITDNKSFEIGLGKLNFSYKEGSLKVGDKCFVAEDGARELHIIIDKGIIEVSTESYVRPCWFEIDDVIMDGEIIIKGIDSYSYSLYEV